MRCRRRFLRFFPDGFTDERYLSWERDYKAEAHTRWTAELSAKTFVQLLAARQYHVIAGKALRIEVAQPDRHMFLKPNVTRLAAARYGFDFHYQSRPNGTTYSQLLNFAAMVRVDQRDLRPRDLIDVQSFLWVQGSEEYQGRSFRSLPTTSVTALQERASQS